MSDAFEYNDKGLKNLIDMFEDDAKMPFTKLGILGDKSNRDDYNTNAAIGAIHEFGGKNMPVRSFLRMPIALKLQQYLDQAGGFDVETIEKAIEEDGLVQLLKKIGVVGETIVSDAFSSRGFGSWKESDMTGKKNEQTLVETTQLRDSITSEVVDVS